MKLAATLTQVQAINVPPKQVCASIRTISLLKISSALVRRPLYTGTYSLSSHVAGMVASEAPPEWKEAFQIPRNNL